MPINEQSPPAEFADHLYQKASAVLLTNTFLCLGKLSATPWQTELSDQNRSFHAPQHADTLHLNPDYQDHHL